MQHIIFSPKYCLRDNFITSNSFQDHIISVCVVILFIFIFSVHSYIEYYEGFAPQYPKNIRLHIVLFDLLYYGIGFVISTSFAIRHQKNNIDFVLTFQKVHIIFNNEKQTKTFILMNCLYIFILFLIYIGFLIFYNYVTSGRFLFTSIYMLLFIVFDINIVYANGLVSLLIDKLYLWNNIFLDYRSNGNISFNTYIQTYVDILKCYRIIKDTFEVLVSL